MKLFRKRKDEGEDLFASAEEPEEAPAEEEEESQRERTAQEHDGATAKEVAKDGAPDAPQDKDAEAEPDVLPADAGFFDLESDKVADFQAAGVIVAPRKPLNPVPALKVLALLAVIAALVAGVVLIWPSSSKRVPSLIGKKLSEAMDGARSAGFDPAVRAWKFSESHPDGVILDQVPRAMDVVKKGSGITLTVSKGPRPSEGVTPEVAAAAPVTPVAPNGSKVICIDPGNQMNPEQEEWSDPGQSTREPPERLERGTITGNPEYLVNMDIAEKLKNLLEKDGVQVVMTRESNDVQLPNIARDDIAASAGANLMVSIHCATSSDPMNMGTRTLYPASSQYTSAIYESSKAAALFIQSDVLKSCGTEDLGTQPAADKAIFNWSKVPVVVSEPAYLSNPRDDSLLAQDDFRWKIAWGLRNGILKYMASP